MARIIVATFTLLIFKDFTVYACHLHFLLFQKDLSECQNQIRYLVGPDLGQNCLQSYQQMTEVTTNGERVKLCFHF